MFSWNLSVSWIFFLFITFWPWEKDLGEVKKSSFEIPSDREAAKVLRVALFYEKSDLEIEIDNSYEIQDLDDGKVLDRGSVLEPTRIRHEPIGIRVGSNLYSVSGLRISSQTKEVRVGKKKYHNVIEVLKNPAGSLTVVNEIDVEDYLKGVLPWESNPDWHPEALKAQAVASRTYAIFENIENKEFAFTLGSDVGSQLYGGKTIEKSASSRAVEATRGEILTYNGKVFPAFFHSTCGGGTAPAEAQWRIQPHPSLKGVECPFCRASRHYLWRAEFTRAEIQTLLAKKGWAVGSVQEIASEKLDAFGRPRSFEIRHDGGKLALSANEFRLALGPDRMRSTRVVIEREGESFVLKGRGWGHGVGMCQFGAKHLAELGYRYRDILRYYYPGSTLMRLDGIVSEPGAVPGTEENVFERFFEKLKSYVEDL